MITMRAQEQKLLPQLKLKINRKTLQYSINIHKRDGYLHKLQDNESKLLETKNKNQITKTLRIFLKMW